MPRLAATTIEAPRTAQAAVLALDELLAVVEQRPASRFYLVSKRADGSFALLCSGDQDRLEAMLATNPYAHAVCSAAEVQALRATSRSNT